jgi:hypothetical protein
MGWSDEGVSAWERTLRAHEREIDRRIEAIGAEVARAFEGEEGERIEYLGEEIFPRPMDTKVFIRIMSRHLVFN